jgi:hypothetical protein
VREQLLLLLQQFKDEARSAIVPPTGAQMAYAPLTSAQPPPGPRAQIQLTQSEQPPQPSHLPQVGFAAAGDAVGQLAAAFSSLSHPPSAHAVDQLVRMLRLYFEQSRQHTLMMLQQQQMQAAQQTESDILSILQEMLEAAKSR